jgi:hypothetical protein
MADQAWFRSLRWDHLSPISVFESMDRPFNDAQARAEAAESALREIREAIGVWMQPGGALVDRELIIVITAILEAIVAPNACEPPPTSPELPLLRD